MTFELGKLPYDYDALEPTISKKTVEFHHDKHHQNYVNGLNKAVEGTEFEKMELCELLRSLDKLPKEIETAVINNGGGHFNHSIYWNSMTPGGASEPVGGLKEAIDKKYGSFEKFKEEFNQKGASQFGSGWVNLVVKDGEIDILQSSNQNTPHSLGYTVILTNDVWEHAYYLDYQNRRADYLDEWFKLVNWDFAEERFKSEK